MKRREMGVIQSGKAFNEKKKMKSRISTHVAGDQIKKDFDDVKAIRITHCMSELLNQRMMRIPLIFP